MVNCGFAITLVRVNACAILNFFFTGFSHIQFSGKDA